MIQLQSVSHTYTIPIIRQDSIKRRPFRALHDITLSVSKGETLAIIGHNGAGKTTLLKVIGGLIDPERGNVEVSGKTACVLDMSAGFHPDMTGRENCLALAPLFESSKEEIQASMADISDFSELEDFFDAPLRTYSQGMYLRLAFAFAVHLKPDIFIMDDIMAVGDIQFRQKCMQKIDTLIQQGISFIFASHDISLIRRYATRICWMEKGAIKVIAGTDEVLGEYFASPASNDQYGPSSGLSVFQIRHCDVTQHDYITMKGYDLVDVNDARVLEYVSTSASDIHEAKAVIEESGPHFIRLSFSGNTCKTEVTISLSKDGLNFSFEWHMVTCLPGAEYLILKFQCPFNMDFTTASQLNENELRLKANHHLLTGKSGDYILCECAPGTGLGFEEHTLSLEGQLKGKTDITGRLSLVKQNWHYAGRGEQDVTRFLDHRYKALFPSLLTGLGEISLGDRSLEWHWNDSALLALAGFEILFLFNHREWSSTEALWQNVSAGAGYFEWIMHHHLWPFVFRVRIQVHGDDIVLKIQKEDIREAPIHHVRIELILAGDITLRTGDLKATINIEKSDGCWDIKPVSASRFALKHSQYQNVPVLYAHMPVLNGGESFQFNITKADPLAGEHCAETVRQDAKESENIFSAEFKLPYLAIESECKWHDTRDALQQWENKCQTFHFYELPVLAKLQTTLIGEGICLKWNFTCLDDMYIQRIQMSFETASSFTHLEFENEKRILKSEPLQEICALRHIELVKQGTYNLGLQNGHIYRVKVLSTPPNCTLALENVQGRAYLTMGFNRYPYACPSGTQYLFDIEVGMVRNTDHD